MSRNVKKKVEDSLSTEKQIDNETVIISKKEYETLKYERDEYKSIALAFKDAMPDIFEIQKNIDQGLKDIRGV